MEFSAISPNNNKRLYWFAGLILFACDTRAQTTQGLILGRVLDAQEGAGIAGAKVFWARKGAYGEGSGWTNSSGRYAISHLSPGTYRLRVTAEGYQSRDLDELEVPVAGLIEVNFRMRPLADVWERGRSRSVVLPGGHSVLNLYGPDVDSGRLLSFDKLAVGRSAIEISASRVMDSSLLKDLPLAGRDVYALLALQPGVSSDTTTSRGLGLSVNGQRPSASSFLLDGVENNNYTVTGPGVAPPPEAVQEYRISTGNFSAEYGRTSGYLANAVTRGATGRWHASPYAYLKNEALNANGFQQNRQGLRRNRLREWHRGLTAEGPLRKRALWISGAFEHLSSSGSGDPIAVRLPSTLFAQYTAPESLARRLLARYAPPPATDRNLPTASLTLEPTSTLSRYLAAPRIDSSIAEGRHRLFSRFTLAKLDRPDFVWTPYRDFLSPLRQHLASGALSALSFPNAGLTHEIRLGLGFDDLSFDRPHPEIPTLGAGDGTVLPGSPAFYAYRNRSRNLELVDNVILIRGRHLIKAGGSLLRRALDGRLTAGRDGLLLFEDFFSFTIDQPALLSAAVSRSRLPFLETPRNDRDYRVHQFAGFAQDSFRAGPRLKIEFGVRYESFGAPINIGPEKDARVDSRGGRLVFPGASDQKLYAPDRNDWAARVGFASRLDARSTLRGAWGLFYDRPYDNLWQNVRSNGIVLATFPLAGGLDYLAPLQQVLGRQQNTTFAQDFPFLTAIDSALRSPYVQHLFLGVQRRQSETLSLEANYLGSIGRKLIATDLLNRPRSAGYQPGLPYVHYRGNQGGADYQALSLSAHLRTPRRQLHATYTLGRAKDNQSDPLAGDFFNLDFTRGGRQSGREEIAAFSRQGDSRADRGPSDFDQRHNLAIYSVWELPGVLRNWKVAQVAAMRSGFGYTVFSPDSGTGNQLIVNNRADLVGSVGNGGPIPGGMRLLQTESFRRPAPGVLGNSGRNGFRGPGLFSLDVSLSRSVFLRRLGNAARATVRADAFNLLNHANLNNPDPFLGSPAFGASLFGRKGRTSSFPAQAPFDETARQVQLGVRLEF